MKTKHGNKRMLMEILSQPNFTEEQMKQYSYLASLLCKWITNIMKYLEIKENVQLKEEYLKRNLDEHNEVYKTTIEKKEEFAKQLEKEKKAAL